MASERGDSSGAEAAFRAYDFASDDRFADFLKRAELASTSLSEQQRTEKLRRLYFRRFVDAALPREAETSARPHSAGDDNSHGARKADHSGADSAPHTAQARSPPKPAGKALSYFRGVLERVQLTRWLNVVILFLSVCGLFAAVLNKSPLREWAVTKAHLIAVFAYLLGLLSKCDAPSFSREYMRRVLSTTEFHYVLFSAIFLAEPRHIRSVLPLLVYSVYNVANSLRKWAAQRRPLLLQRFRAGERIDRLNAGAAQANSLVAVTEMSLLLELVLGLVGSLRNARRHTSLALAMLVAYPSFLRLRAKHSAYARNEWTRLDGFLRGIAARWAPGMLPAYMRIQAGVSSWANGR